MLKWKLAGVLPKKIHEDLLIVPLAPRKKEQQSNIKLKSSFERCVSYLPEKHQARVRDELGYQSVRTKAFSRLDVQVAGVGGDALREIVCVGCIDKDATHDSAVRKLGATIANIIREKRPRSVAVLILPDLESGLGDIIEGMSLASYEFSRYRKSSGQTWPKHTSLYSAEHKFSKAVESAAQAAKNRVFAIAFARDLVSAAPSDLQPKDLVSKAKAISRRRAARIKLRVYDRKALTRMGAGALLAVSRGSDTPPYLIHFHLAGKNARRRKVSRIVIIGKGVTFDSGGLSIKSGKGMEDMKCDMAGAAAVLGVMNYLQELAEKDLPALEIHGIIPTTENMINGSSVKPGDVVQAVNGKTIEVLNTDAEGRLILADALSFAERLKPDLVIDLATLTGACVVALGDQIAGLFTRDDSLRKQIISSGLLAGEEFWPLPLAECYRKLIKSSVADIKNIGPGGPGATIGALFLEEFVPKNCRWAHLDIAGPAFASKDSDWIRAGGTGFGVGTLIRLLETELEKR